MRERLRRGGIGVGGLLLLALAATAVQAQTQITGSRDLPGRYQAGQQVTVTIQISVDETQTPIPNGLIVNEFRPVGWPLVSSTPGARKDEQNTTGLLSWVFFGGDVKDMTIQYVLTAPAGTTGTPTFNGELKYTWGGQPFTVAVTGDTQIPQDVGPNVPDLIAPAADAVVGPTPTFRVQSTDPNGDQVKYTVEVTIGGATSTFLTGLLDSGAEAVLEVPAGQALPSGAGTWRAKAEDSTGLESVWSAARSLTVNRNPGIPTLVAPANNAAVSLTPTLQAQASDPDGNQVKITFELTKGATTKTYETGLLDSGTTASLTVPEALEAGDWSWRAQAEDSLGFESDWSPTQVFIANQAPGQAELVSPADGAVVPPTPTLQVRATEPDGDQVKFTLELTKGTVTRLFETALVNSGVTASLSVPADQALESGVWTWRAKAIDSKGTEGDWSAARTLRVNRSPAAPQLLAPANAAVVTPLPTLQARATDPEGNQVRITIELSKGATVRIIELGPVASGATAEWTADAELESGVWSWRAQAKDSLNFEGAWSATWTFTVNRAPGQAVLVAPADDAEVVPSPTLQMQAPDPDGDQVKFIVTLTKGAITKTFETGLVNSGATASLTVPEALEVGTWTWSAKPVDAKGTEGPASDPRTFRVVNTPPSVPTLTEPATEVITSPWVIFGLSATDADGDQVKFEIELKGPATKTLESGLVNSGATATVEDTNLAAGAWTWRARAIDSKGSPGEWSTERTFTVMALLPRVSQGGGVSTLGLPFQSAPMAPADLGLGGLRIAIWDPTPGSYLFDAQVTQVTTGRGYWLKATNATPLRVSGQAVTPPYAIPLKTGWNFVAAPFLQPVIWSLSGIKVRVGQDERTLAGAQQAGWIEDLAWGWEPAQADPNTGQYALVYDTSVLPDVAGEWKPWAAYWVRANRDCELLVQPGGGNSRKAEPSLQGWTLQVQARSAAGSAQVVVGVTEGRAVLADEPPAAPVSGSLRLRVANGDRLLAADVRRSGRPKQVWTLVVERAGTAENEEIALRWPNAGRLPAGLSLMLVDKATGERRSLHSATAYVFRPAAGETSRAFEVVAQQGRDRPLRINGLRGTPTRGSGLELRFSLSEMARTTVRMRDLSGRTVGTVEQERSRAAGEQTVPWDGRDEQGRRLLPGVYLVEVQAMDAEGRQARAVATVILR